MYKVGISAGSVDEGTNHGLVVTFAEDFLALPILIPNQFQCGNILLLFLLAFPC